MHGLPLRLVFSQCEDKASSIVQADDHPNIAIIQQFNPADPATAAKVFSPNIVWHYFNPRLPDVHGDYVGIDGIREFFEKMARQSTGTFKVEPVSAHAAGDELVIVQTRNTMTLQDQAIAIDVVLVWRIVDGLVTEVWDIPSLHTLAATN